MLEDLFKLLADAKKESDVDKKISLFEEYSDKLKTFLKQPKIQEKYSKKDLETLNTMHDEVLKETERIFSSFKDDIKDFQKKNKGIKAYMNMPKNVAITNYKKG